MRQNVSPEFPLRALREVLQRHRSLPAPREVRGGRSPPAAVGRARRPAEAEIQSRRRRRHRRRRRRGLEAEAALEVLRQLELSRQVVGKL